MFFVEFQYMTNEFVPFSSVSSLFVLSHNFNMFSEIVNGNETEK